MGSYRSIWSRHTQGISGVLLAGAVSFNIGLACFSHGDVVLAILRQICLHLLQAFSNFPSGGFGTMLSIGIITRNLCRGHHSQHHQQRYRDHPHRFRVLRESLRLDLINSNVMIFFNDEACAGEWDDLEQESNQQAAWQKSNQRRFIFDKQHDASSWIPDHDSHFHGSLTQTTLP